MRKPRVQNKYNLTMKDCRNLELKNREEIEKTFWRNNVINAYCLSGNTAKNNKDHEFGTYSEYWIGVYDKDDKIKVDFSSYGGMCGYKFKEFYSQKDIENNNDLEVQELFLEKINELLDEKIFKLKVQ